MKTYSLAACADKILGPDCGMKDPRGWLLRGIRAGRFEAYKVGHNFRMSQEQIDAAIESLKFKPAMKAPEPERVPERPAGPSLTATSARRLRLA